MCFWKCKTLSVTDDDLCQCAYNIEVDACRERDGDQGE